MISGIFLHVPKTGGTSLFTEVRKVSCCMPNFHLWTGHTTAMLRQERLRETMGCKAAELFWRDSFTFAFIRNPWDHLVSWYHARHESIPADIESFDQWIHEGMALSTDFRDVFVQSDQRTTLDQDAYFCDLSGKSLVQFVGRFERLQQDYITVCKKLRINNSVLSNINKSDHEPYQTYYTPETKTIVANRFDNFIKRFSYTF